MELLWDTSNYYQTNTTTVVFYSVLGGLSNRCFLKNAPHFHRALIVI